MSRKADFYFVEFHCVSFMFFCSCVFIFDISTKAHIFLFCLFFNALTLCFSGILSKNHSRLGRFRQKDIMSRMVDFYFVEFHCVSFMFFCSCVFIFLTKARKYMPLSMLFCVFCRLILVFIIDLHTFVNYITKYYSNNQDLT